MLKGGWKQYATPGIAIFAAAVIVAVAVIAYPREPSVREQHRVSESGENTYSIKSDGDGGFEFSIVREPEGAKTENNAKPNQDSVVSRTTTQADLLAQERMAYWTAWIAGFTFLGLALLAWTLHETREVARITREIGQKQTRGYLTVTGFDYALHLGQFVGTIKVRNTGNSPIVAAQANVRFIMPKSTYIPDDGTNEATLNLMATIMKVEPAMRGSAPAINAGKRQQEGENPTFTHEAPPKE